MLLTTPVKPIDYSQINGNFFELTDQLFKRLEAGEPIVEIALDSEEMAIDIEERFNYLVARRNLPFCFILTETRPNVYRIELEEGEWELAY